MYIWSNVCVCVCVRVFFSVYGLKEWLFSNPLFSREDWTKSICKNEIIESVLRALGKK